MRRASEVSASARVLEQGKRLVVCEVAVVQEGAAEDPVAHAVMTDSVPPR
jgi:acyl-coenzyme A thioesterase PaaI-like protein